MREKQTERKIDSYRKREKKYERVRMTVKEQERKNKTERT